MKSFLEYITEAVRTGLQTPGNSSGNVMDHNALHELIHKGHVDLREPTEKTDGSVMHLHYDDKGFGTQYSGSGNEIMRSKSDYHERAKRRSNESGKPYNHNVPEGFGKFHESLAANKGLQDYMKSEYKRTGKPVHIQGEAFNRHMGEHHPDGTWQGAVTKYDTSKMGKHGMFVIHSKLPGNEEHTNHADKMQGGDVKIDHDKIDFKPMNVDVSDEAEKLKGLNHELLNSRTTPKNKEAKLAEQNKVVEIGNSVEKKTNAAIASQHIKPKWGNETEGLVFHPTKDQNIRWKSLNKNFTDVKKSDEYKSRWKSKK